MSAKKHKDNLTYIATIRKIYLEKLDGKLVTLEKIPKFIEI